MHTPPPPQPACLRSALEHHLEDVYLDSIKALVVADLGLAPELVADIKLGGGKGRSIGQRSPS